MIIDDHSKLVEQIRVLIAEEMNCLFHCFQNDLVKVVASINNSL